VLKIWNDFFNAYVKEEFEGCCKAENIHIEPEADNADVGTVDQIGVSEAVSFSGDGFLFSPVP
jgi:hypothetical protein